MQTFSFVEMWRHMGLPARAVVVVLAAMSIYSLGIMAERYLSFERARRLSLRFVAGLSGLLKGRDLLAAKILAGTQPQSPVARVIAAGLAEYQEGLDAPR